MIRNTTLLVVLVLLAVGLQANDTPRQVDARLSRTVTISATATPVCELLKELSKQTEVEFSAGEHIRDRKVTMFVTERPVSEIMAQLKSHLRCMWSFREDKAGVRSYRLRQDKKSRDYEEWLRESKSAEAAEEYRERRNRAIADRLLTYKDALSLSEDELPGLAVEDPNLVWDLRKPLTRSLVPFLNTLPPESISKLFSLNIPFDDLPRGVQELIEEDLRKKVPSGYPVPQITSIGFAGEEFPADVFLSYETSDGNSYGGYSGGSVISDKNRYPESTIEGLLRDSTITEAQRAESLEMRRIRLEEAARAEENALKDAGSEPEDPDLLKVIELNLESLRNPVESVMEALAKASGVNLLADHFTGWTREIPSWVNEEIPLYNAVHAVCKIYDLEWGKQGSYLVIKDREWYKKIPLEVPKWFLDKWRARLEEKKAFDLDDLAEAASDLTPAQASGTLHFFSEFRSAGFIYLRFFINPLKLYHSLDASQRQQVWKEGLPWNAMTPRQKELFLHTVNSIFPPVVPSDQDLAEHGLMWIGPTADWRDRGREVVKLSLRYGLGEDYRNLLECEIILSQKAAAKADHEP